jgi:AAA family ATP:ADP antiporter
MMLVSASILLLCLLLTNLVHIREKAHSQSVIQREQADQPLDRQGGFQLVVRHRYLLLIGLVILVINWVNTNGEYILARTVSQRARDFVAAGTVSGLSERQMIGSFYAEYQFWYNLLGALFQLFLVSRILKYLGVGRALFIMPVISLCSYTLLAAVPVLTYIRAAKILENSTDYSLQNTVRHALFLPTSREAKYKAKQAVDTFFWRTGDLLSGLSVFVGTGILGLGVRNLAGFTAGLVVLWLLLAAGIAREHRKLVAEPQAEAARTVSS